MAERGEYIESVRALASLDAVRKQIEGMGRLSALVIGDTIIDEYVFVTPKGRAVKDPILSVGYNSHEAYPGGILAIANHLSDFVGSLTLVTLHGEDNPRLDFMKESLRSNIRLKSFPKPDSPTTVKKRYVDFVRNNKLFKIEFMNDRPIGEGLAQEIAAYLGNELPRHDLVIVGDFGHGFINSRIRDVLQEKAKFLSVNVQSNSANMGYNYYRLYKKLDFMSMDEQELRLPLLRRFEPVEDVIREAHKTYGYDKFLITLGKKGSVYFEHGKTYSAPVLTDSVKDTVGAGDALFALASLFVYAGAKPEIVPFIANCAGGIAVNIMGNKEHVSAKNLLGFIRNVLEGKPCNGMITGI